MMLTLISGDGWPTFGRRHSEEAHSMSPQDTWRQPLHCSFHLCSCCSSWPTLSEGSWVKSHRCRHIYCFSKLPRYQLLCTDIDKVCIRKSWLWPWNGTRVVRCLQKSWFTKVSWLQYLCAWRWAVFWKCSISQTACRCFRCSHRKWKA